MTEETYQLRRCDTENIVSINLKEYSADYKFVVISHGDHTQESEPVVIRTPQNRKFKCYSQLKLDKYTC